MPANMGGLNLSHTRYTLQGNRKYQWSGSDVDLDRVRIKSFGTPPVRG